MTAIQAGDLATLQRLLTDNPGLAVSRLGGIANGRSPLHVAADWPGCFPNGPQIVRMLIEAGADPNARDPDKPGSETPLHWAASSDDVDVASAMIDGGASVDVSAIRDRMVKRKARPRAEVILKKGLCARGRYRGFGTWPLGSLPTETP
jgi:hypothetical protein